MDYIEIFNSVADFSAALNGRELNHVFKDAGVESSKTKRESFTGTKDYKTADYLFNAGDASNLNKLQSVNFKNTPVDNQLKKLLQKSVCGGVPIVPLAVMGIPKNMLTSVRRTTAARVVDIVYNITFSASISTNNIIKAGAKVASLVKCLEQRRVRVNLYVAFSSTEGTDKSVRTAIKLKEASAPLNMLRLAYPLINPSFLRRHMFRFLETVPAEIDEQFTQGYGRVEYFNDKSKQAFIKAGINKNSIFINGSDLINADINQMADKYFIGVK